MSTGDPVAFGHCTCPSSWWGIYPPPPCSYCQRWMTPTTHPVHSRFVPAPVVPVVSSPLTDSDVQRIADEVVRRLREAKE